MDLGAGRQAVDDVLGVFDRAFGEGPVLQAEDPLAVAPGQGFPGLASGCVVGGPELAEPPFGTGGGAVDKDEERALVGGQGFVPPHRGEDEAVLQAAAVEARTALGQGLGFELGAESPGRVGRDVDAEKIEYPDGQPDDTAFSGPAPAPAEGGEFPGVAAVAGKRPTAVVAHQVVAAAPEDETVLQADADDGVGGDLDFLAGAIPGAARRQTVEEAAAGRQGGRRFVRLTAPPEFGDALLAVLRSSDPNAPRAPGSLEAQVQRGAQLFGIDLVAFANRMIAGRMAVGGEDGRDKNAINQLDRGLNCAGCHTPVHTTGKSPAAIGGRHLSNVYAPIFSDLLLHDGPEVTPERVASTPRDPVVIVRDGYNTLDLSRNLVDDALIGPLQGLANGKEFRTPPLMGIGKVGPPFLHDARVYLSRFTRDTYPAGTVYSNSEVTNAPLVVRTFEDALRAVIELHDLPAPDDAKTPAGGGCPVPSGRRVGEIRYSGPDDICPPYTSALSQRNRSESREVMRRFRSLSPADQMALIEFLKQL